MESLHLIPPPAANELHFEGTNASYYHHYSQHTRPQHAASWGPHQAGLDSAQRQQATSCDTARPVAPGTGGGSQQRHVVSSDARHPRDGQGEARDVDRTENTSPGHPQGKEPVVMSRDVL